MMRIPYDPDPMEKPQTRKADDGVELVPVPMSRETRKRLVAFARAIGKPEGLAAAELFAELLNDDEFWNAARDTRALN